MVLSNFVPFALAPTWKVAVYINQRVKTGRGFQQNTYHIPTCGCTAHHSNPPRFAPCPRLSQTLANKYSATHLSYRGTLLTIFMNTDNLLLQLPTRSTDGRNGSQNLNLLTPMDLLQTETSTRFLSVKLVTSTHNSARIKQRKTRGWIRRYGLVKIDDIRISA